MRKTILIIGVFTMVCVVSVAQTKNDSIQQLKHRIKNLENSNSRLSKQVNTANSNIKILEEKVSSAVDSIDVLKQDLALTNITLQEITNKLELQIAQTNEAFSVLSKRLSYSATIGRVITIVAILLISAFLIRWLKRKFTSLNTELSHQIKTSSGVIMNEIAKLDNKVYWSLDFQKELSKEDKNGSAEVDHSLALKVADEIIRIQKNLTGMDPETKGLKQLEFAVDRIQDNFRENGYEMVNLLNKPYDPGMKSSAKFKLDETLKPGEKIITRIIKPQINFNNTVIQEAEIEVSAGE